MKIRNYYSVDSLFRANRNARKRLWNRPLGLLGTRESAYGAAALGQNGTRESAYGTAPWARYTEKVPP